MQVLPKIPILHVTPQAERPSQTYAIDWKNGRIRGRIDHLDAVKQACKKALLTVRFACDIYDNQYGSELSRGIIQASPSRVLAEKLARATIRETLLADNRVLDVRDISVQFEADDMIIEFTVVSRYGTYTDRGVF